MTTLSGRAASPGARTWLKRTAVRATKMFGNFVLCCANEQGHKTRDAIRRVPHIGYCLRFDEPYIDRGLGHRHDLPRFSDL